MQVGPKTAPLTGEYLDYNEVMDRFDVMTDWLANLYVNTLNVIPVSYTHHPHLLILFINYFYLFAISRFIYCFS